MKRSRTSIRRQAGSRIGAGADLLERGDEEIVLVGDQPMQAEGEANPLHKTGRLRHRVAHDDRGAIDEAILDPQIAFERAILDRIGRDFAKKAMVEEPRSTYPQQRLACSRKRS